jgi:NADPH:quinone reductase-like Zn-dependent oxidoreductase
MRAVVIEDFIGVNGLTVKPVDRPEILSEDQAMVRVFAAGVNRADLLQAKGLYPPPEGVDPKIPGLEFAGVIETVSGTRSRFKSGDRVCGITSGMAQAEYLVESVDLMLPIPEKMDFVTAAAMPEAYITAHDALITQCSLSKNETVLIHSIGSGVGLAALNIARLTGAFTIGSSRSSSKIEKALALGLDKGFITSGQQSAESGTSTGVTDTVSFEGDTSAIETGTISVESGTVSDERRRKIGESTAEFAKEFFSLTGDKGADVILDLVGGSFTSENLKAASSQGRIIVVGLVGGTKAEINLSLLLKKRLKIFGTVLRSRTKAEKAEAMRSFENWAAPFFVDGSIRPIVDSVFRIGEVREAYRKLAENRNFGKVILTFD